MGMEVDSDALKWENGADEWMAASIFGLEGERSESRWNDEEFASEHQWHYLSTDLYGQMVNDKLTFKFSQFELHACVILLVILNGAMQPKQLNCFNSVRRLWKQTFSTT